jgi:hypothetical protein
MKRRLRAPSPSMVVALIALFVSLGGSAYAVATIGSDDIINGSIRNRDFKDGTLRGQEAKRDGFGGGAIKESTLGQVPGAALAVVADGVTRHAVISNVGGAVRHRGATSSARLETGRYQVIFDRDVRNCVYAATLGDESAAGPGQRADLRHVGAQQRKRRACGDAGQQRRSRRSLVPPGRLLLGTP